MASAFQKSPGKWWARFKDENGRWKSVPTKERTRRQALQVAMELERRAQRIRDGIDPDLGDGAEADFAWLANWWMEAFGSRLRSDSFCQYLRKHVIPALGTLRLSRMRSDHIERLLHDLESKNGLSPKTCNDVRAAIHRVFVQGYRQGMWRGRNPVEDVERRKVPKRPPPPVLRAEEVPAFLAAAPEEW